MVLSLFASCSDVTNEIWVDKDGSGRMKLSADLATLIPPNFLRDMGGGAQDSSKIEQKNTMVPESPAPRLTEDDPISPLIEKMIKDGEIFDFDTTVSMIELMPDSLKARPEASDLDYFEDVLLHLHGDKAKGTAMFTFDFVFQDGTKMLEMLSALQTEMSLKTEKDNPVVDKEVLARQYQKNFKRGIFQLPAFKMPDKLPGKAPEGAGEDLGGLLKSSDGEMSDEEKAKMNLMKAMFGNVVVKIHLPGPVEFTNDPDAEIIGNTVIFKKSIIDFFKEENKDRIVKFKTK